MLKPFMKGKISVTIKERDEKKSYDGKVLEIVVNNDQFNKDREEKIKELKDTKHLKEWADEADAAEKAEIKKLAEIATIVKPDYIKTSTGFGSGGATVEDVALMVKTVHGTVKVKAAGGIRSWETCKAMIEAGASRIGTSSSVKILKEFEEA